MKNTLKYISIISLFLFINTSHSIPEGTQRMKACTFHGVIYNIIQPDTICPLDPVIFDLSEIPVDNDDGEGFTAPRHPKTIPHNPECFNSHIVFR